MPLRQVRDPHISRLKQDLEFQTLLFADSMADRVIKGHEKIVENWKKKPKFVKKLKKKAFGFVVEVIPAGDEDAVQIWWWVNNGTGSRGGGQNYDIVPKKAGGVLSFNLGYTPKTTFHSYGGPGAATGPKVFARSVRAKGIRPRNFSRLVAVPIIKNAAKSFRTFVRKALFRR